MVIATGPLYTEVSEMLMCRGCGNFVTAVDREGSITPLSDECPECGGVEFEHIHTETVVRSD